MLADSAASAMAAVISEAAALPWRPAHHSSGRPGSSSGPGHSAAGASAEIDPVPSRPPPRPVPERLAAAGYLTDLTWVLEGACGSPAASGGGAASGPAAAAPSTGLWAAHNALAAVAGWLEGSLQWAGRPDAAAMLPSATLQAAVARAAVAMVGTAQRLLASGAGAGASGRGGSSRSSGGSGSGYSSPVRGSRQPWQADSAPFRMACTGAQPPLSISAQCAGCAVSEASMRCGALVRHACKKGFKLLQPVCRERQMCRSKSACCCK